MVDTGDQNRAQKHKTVASSSQTGDATAEEEIEGKEGRQKIVENEIRRHPKIYGPPDMMRERAKQLNDQKTTETEHYE